EDQTATGRVDRSIRMVRTRHSIASTEVSRRFVSRLIGLVLVLGLSSQISPAIAQTHAGAKESPAQNATTQMATQLQQNQALQDVVAKQAALVTEFDVNGLKVLVKKREGSLTVAAGLFI